MCAVVRSASTAVFAQHYMPNIILQSCSAILQRAYHTHTHSHRRPCRPVQQPQMRAIPGRDNPCISISVYMR
jgi:hypothetical protein